MVLEVSIVVHSGEVRNGGGLSGGSGGCGKVLLFIWVLLAWVGSVYNGLLSS